MQTKLNSDQVGYCLKGEGNVWHRLKIKKEFQRGMFFFS